MTKVTPQPVSRQVVTLMFDSRSRTQETRVTAAIAYVHPQKSRPELITGASDLEVTIKMGEVGAGAPSSEGWREIIQPSFKSL